MTEDQIVSTVSRFVAKNFLFDETKSIDPTTSLLGSGILDSTGILELIAFLEDSYELKFRDEELVAENFDSIENIRRFLIPKLSLLAS